MPKHLNWMAGFLLLGATMATAARVRSRRTAADKIVEEIWESAHLDGVKIGSVHTTVRTVGGDENACARRSRWN